MSDTTTAIHITPLLEEHFGSVREIYMQGIASGNATFETTCPPYAEWDGKHLHHSRLIALEEKQVVGWAALSGVSERCVYDGVAEVSVYVHEKFAGRGFGFKLLSELVKSSEANNIWTLQAGIFPENKASIHLHEKCDFRLVGTREKLGKMNDRWRDVLLMERRSGLM